MLGHSKATYANRNNLYVHECHIERTRYNTVRCYKVMSTFPKNVLPDRAQCKHTAVISLHLRHYYPLTFLEDRSMPAERKKTIKV